MSRVRYAVSDAIAEITLDHPPLNALDIGFLDEILAAFSKAGADAAVHAVILSSAVPGRFSAGLDLTGVRSADVMHVHALLERLYLGMAEVQYRLGKPSIAAVGGVARGGGMTLAIQCNMILAAKSATFGYPEVDVGLIPAIHFIHLPKIIGRHRAFDLLFTGRVFDADEAHSLGLVSRVVDDARLLDEARALARTFAAKPGLAMRMGHAAFMRHNDYRTDLGHVTEAFTTVAATPEARAAVEAFFKKPK